MRFLFLLLLVVLPTGPVRADDPAAELAAGIAAYEAGRYTQAFRILRPLAEAGAAEAQYHLGLLYRDGAGVEWRDAEKAADWFRKAAEQGHAMGQVHLAVRYMIGDGVKQHLRTARDWYRKAHEQGEVWGTYGLGVMAAYNEPRSNGFLAWNYFKDSAARGHVESMYELAQVLSVGWVGLRDIPAALEWYRRAMEHHYPYAVSSYAAISSIEGLWDQGEDVYWQYILRAAKLGNPVSQISVAQAYQSGDVFEKNDFEALKWGLVAAKSGVYRDRLNLTVLRWRLGRDLTRQAEDWAERWQPSRPVWKSEVPAPRGDEESLSDLVHRYPVRTIDRTDDEAAR